MSSPENTLLSAAVKAKSRIYSIDTFRLISTFFIVITHSNVVEKMFVKGMSAAHIIFSFTTLSFLRLGLPFVFVASGYFMTKKLISSKEPWDVFIKVIPRLLTAYAFWCFIYALVPWDYSSFFESVHQSGFFKALYWSFLYNIGRYDFIYVLFNGTQYHLYFLPTLVISLFTITLLTSIKKHYLLKYIFWICYWGQLMFISYQDNEVYHHIKEGFVFGLCSAVAHVLCGYFIAQEVKIQAFRARRMIGLGIICLLTQYYLMWTHHLTNGWEMKYQTFVGTLPIVAGLFQLALLHPEIGKNTVLPKLGLMTLGIYCIHPLILAIVQQSKLIHSNFWGMDFVTPVIVYAITLCLCILLRQIPLTERLVS